MKAKITVLGLLAGAAMVVPMTASQEAAADTYIIQKADPNDTARTRVRNGVTQLRATDEEMTNEQPAVAFAESNTPDGKKLGVIVMMSTGQLASPAGENSGQQLPQTNSNMQGSCMPVALEPDPANADLGVAVTRDTANFKYITARNADDSRAFNNPGVVPLGNYGGKELFAVTAGWDENNEANTERRIQVVDQECNLIQLQGNVPRQENNTSAVIMAKNNDNCSGRQSGGGASTYKSADGVTHYVAAELCNGNGRDDGWQNYLQITPAADGNSVNVQKIGDTSFITREERSRGRCELIDTNGDGIPVETSFCCGTEGNSQPQREGVWCAGIDNASGELLYRERIAYRGETAEGLRTYAMRMKMLAERDASGALTGNVFLQYQMHRGRNNNNKKGGYDDAVLLAVAKPNAQSTNVQFVADLTPIVIQSGLEPTHATLFQTHDGTPGNYNTVLNLMSGNHNGNADVTKVMQVRVDTTAGTASNLGLSSLQASFDAQKYAKYLGNNPNNQGRNYNDCESIDNPAAATDNTKPPKVNICVQTGKLTDPATGKLENVAIKPSLLMEVWSTMQGQAVTPDPIVEGTPLPEAPSTEEGTTSGPGGSTGGSTPGTPSPGNSVGGCSVNGGSAGGSAAFVLFGLAIALRRRRRS